MTCLMTVRCKICMETHQLAEETVVISAELATFTSAHDHEVVDFDLLFEIVGDHAVVQDS